MLLSIMQTVWSMSGFYKLILMRKVLTFLCIILKNLFAEAYDALDPEGNITMKWDVMSWTPDGYVVSLRTCLSVMIHKTKFAKLFICL